MSRSRSTLSLITLVVANAACASEYALPDTSLIDQAEVERIITVLAADDMRGRRAFTDDARRAAVFLADEFRDAGLTPLDGTDGHLQEFSVQSISPDEARVTVGGRALSADQFAVRAGEAAFHWTTGDARVVVVGDGDDGQQVAFAAMNSGDDALILFDETQVDAFRALVPFFRRPVRSVGNTSTSSVVLALVNATSDTAYEIEASATVVDEPLVNVAGMIPGNRADEFVLFSAHYDHIGIRPAVDGDSIANGANDDASGTTAVVSLAKYFASRGKPERTLLFAAFTAEEGGGYGSRYFSTQLNPDEIVAMFNIEMIGKPAVSGPNTAWITGFERSSFGPLLQEAVVGTSYEFYADPYPAQNLFYRSDNATLARLGVPAHSISTTPIDVDPDYHQVSDHVETLDLAHMTNTIRAIAMGAEPMIWGEVTPTRVDPATVNR
jgi:hypothetical protein